MFCASDSFIIFVLIMLTSMRNIIYLFSLITTAPFIFSSCSSIKLGNKSSLSSGYYIAPHHKKVYVDTDQNDEIHIYEQENSNVMQLVSTYAIQSNHNSSSASIVLTKSTFDFDLITIPIKLRPSVQNVPAQFNNNLNMAAFTGYRKDFHKISYKSSPLNIYKRKISNFGIAAGVVSGLSGTFINETTTSFNQRLEYDGITWMYGLSMICGWNQLTFGLTTGRDVLLDHNRSIWVYNHQTWYGLTIGLHLN